VVSGDGGGGTSRRSWRAYAFVAAVVLVVLAVAGVVVAQDRSRSPDELVAEQVGAEAPPSPSPPSSPSEAAATSDDASADAAADASGRAAGADGTDGTDSSVVGAIPDGYTELGADGSLFSEVPTADRRSPEGCLEIDGSPGSGAMVRGCVVATGSGGTFAVVSRSGGENRETYEVLRRDGGSWRVVLATEELRVGGLPEDWLGVFLRAVRSGGEPGVVVSYAPTAASGVHPTFELLTWDEGADAPTVNVVLHGGRGAFIDDTRDGFQLFEPNFDDGAPMCCPTREDVWDVRRVGSGVWAGRVSTRPLDALNTAPGEEAYLG
jgi:hypothetical protein